MKHNLEHLLSKHGILTSFSIAKRFDEESLKKITEKIKSVAKNKIDFNTKLRAEIENNTAESILSGEIPGLIIDNMVKPPMVPKKKQNSPDKQKKLIYNVDKAKLAELYTLSSAFCKEALNKKFSKNDICFIIYTILNFLEISDEDFKKFHDDLSKNTPPPSDSEDGGDDDDFGGNDDE